MLTEIQQERARYDGGKDIGHRKSHLARSATALRKLRNDATQAGNALDGLFTSAEIEAISAAIQAVGKACDRLDADNRDAKAIKADYDKRVKEAAAVFDTLPHTSIDDIVALAALNNPTQPISRYELIYIRETPQQLKNEMATIARDTLGDLARSCAYKKASPSATRFGILTVMQAWKNKHADLISELNTLAVQAQLEKVG